jgi:hypothetical protein
VTVVVRMPDGSRQGRCFLKTDKLKVNNFEMHESRTKNICLPSSFLFLYFLYRVINTCLLACMQFLFDFLDIGRICKPGTYRLVIVYH